MQNFRELTHKFIEVSHFKIGILKLKLLNLKVQFWVPIMKAIGITEKSDMKLG